MKHQSARRRRNTRWTVPLIREAIALREEDGLSYRAISVVLARYHGLAVSEQAVRYQLRAHGVAGADRALTLGNLAVGPGGPLRRDVAGPTVARPTPTPTTTTRGGQRTDA